MVMLNSTFFISSHFPPNTFSFFLSKLVFSCEFSFMVQQKVIKLQSHWRNSCCLCVTNSSYSLVSNSEHQALIYFFHRACSMKGVGCSLYVGNNQCFLICRWLDNNALNGTIPASLGTLPLTQL
jgi:hypothetical protein